MKNDSLQKALEIIKKWDNFVSNPQSFTLFLDRDGVLNKKIEQGYVKSWAEFEWNTGALGACVQLSKFFLYTFVVTNQQGIGKGLMTEYDLQHIHNEINMEVIECGGNIANFYYCPHLQGSKCGCRKPDVGMALRALKSYPLIQASRCIMVGDSISDMEFGKKMGMRTVFVINEGNYYKQGSHLIDLKCGSLAEFAYLVSQVVKM